MRTTWCRCDKIVVEFYRFLPFGCGTSVRDTEEIPTNGAFFPASRTVWRKASRVPAPRDSLDAGVDKWSYVSRMIAECTYKVRSS